MWTLIICAIAAVFQTEPQPPRTLDGRAVDPLRAEQGVRAVALVFTRTDCPVANQAAPEIERVRMLYADRGVRFWLVYVDPQESPDRIRAHQREYGLGAPVLRDPDHVLVRQAGVHVTPEAAVYVFDADTPRLAYRGRIDDRVIELGRQRPRATRFDLRDALESTLDRKASELVATPAAGCEIADLR
jgi:AhpC/TSA family